MRRFFTSPASATFVSGGCRLRFREIGLFAEFTSFADGAGTPATCDFFLGVVARAQQWHTARGLRVGGTVSSLRRAYPRAYRSGEVGGTHWGIPSGAIRWELAAAAGVGEAARPVLVAYVKEERVVALGIETVGH
jgi:hypothetical protein